MSHVRGNGGVVYPYATTGIAATLLDGGRTVHSGYKLPVPLIDTSVSSIKPSSLMAKALKDATLLIMDEITMLPKHGLRCIDTLLRDIMKTNVPFGGKVLVISGNFRQTLPVIQRGTWTDILDTCIKSSPL